jgi:hypothetical protein
MRGNYPHTEICSEGETLHGGEGISDSTLQEAMSHPLGFISNPNSHLLDEATKPGIASSFMAFFRAPCTPFLK